MDPNKAKTLKAFLKQSEQDALLISHPSNVRFFSGFMGTFGHILFWEGKPCFVTDPRYALAAQKSLPAFDLRVLEQGQKLGGILKKLFKEKGIKSIGVEKKYFLHTRFEELKDHVHVSLLDISRLRAKKNAQELEAIRQSAKLTSLCYTHLLGLIKDGVTEKELEREIKIFFLKHNSEAAFPPIVAFGPSSAIPHYQTGTSKLKMGDTILLDFGAKQNGFCSDITRTLFWGRTSQKQKKIYNAVLKAQEIGLDAVQTGVACKHLDQKVRDFFKKEKLDQYFTHGLGHGIGLEVHERPVLSPQSQDTFKSGMAFTIEPGLYIEKTGGVRIEDDMALTQSGKENLTPIQKELLIL